jgi:hypothetical protein
VAAGLRKAVVLGPAGCIWPGSPQDLRYSKNRAWLKETGTRWVRMWADWPSLQPAAGQYDWGRVSALDAQIDTARADGGRIVLTLYRFPTWANGTAALTATQLQATMPDRKRAIDPDSKAKSLLFRYPADVSEASAFGRFVEFLMRRYAGRIHFLELCNEPNHQWWPLHSPSLTTDPYASGTIIVHDVVTRMFITAKAIQTRIGSTAPPLAGPGLSDTLDGGRLRVPYHSMTERILTRLAERGFRGGPRFAYTHHNYSDVTYDQGAGSTSPDAATTPPRFTNRAADLRRRLVNRWWGWPYGDGVNPQLLLTEGGVTLGNIKARWGITDPAGVQAKQGDLLRRNFTRMAAATGEGAGIAMLSQYLFHTDPNFDAGLCNTPETGGATRTAYGAWKALPSYV